MGASFEITGDASYAVFQWASEMSKHIKTFTYNKSTKILNVYITPGTGITLVSNGEIKIGTIKGTGLKEDTVKLLSVKIVKGDYEASEEIITTPGDKITSSTYTIKDGYISEISAGTSIPNLKKNLQASKDFVIKNKNGNVVGNGITCTGMTLLIGSTTYELVVTGDTNGDGEIGTLDLAQTKSHYIDIRHLTGAALKAADMNGDGEISPYDIGKIKAEIIK